MAKVFNNENSLEAKYYDAKKKINIGFVLLLIALCSAIFVQSLGIVLGLTAFLYTSAYTKKYAILKQGIEGELKTTEILSELPNDYYIFNDVEVTVEGKKSQLDHIVVGPNGVFVVETKNLKGTIKGNEDEKKWQQIKEVNFNRHKKHFYNPTKQVRTHCFRLAQYLREQNLGHWVEPAVFFTNEEANILAQTDKVKTCSLQQGKYELLDHIMNSSNPLSKSKQQKVIDAIVKIAK